MVPLSRTVDSLERFYGLIPAPPHDVFALYVWEVMGAYTIPQKREAAIAALRRIPALTPDSVWKAARAKLEAAVALAGPRREERLQALLAGVDVLRRHADLAARLRTSLAAGRRALRLLPHLGQAGAHLMLLFAADYPIIPLEPGVVRVASRLGFGRSREPGRKGLRSIRHALAAAIGRDLAEIRRTVTYFRHHSVTTCLAGDPHCHVCPLREECEGCRQ